MQRLLAVVSHGRIRYRLNRSEHDLPACIEQRGDELQPAHVGADQAVEDLLQLCRRTKPFGEIPRSATLNSNQPSRITFVYQNYINLSNQRPLGISYPET